MDENPPEFLSLDLAPKGEPVVPIPVVTFQGNNYDLVAVVAVTVGGVTLLTCGTCNLGMYVLPFAPLILGLIGLLTAKDSINPQRTKLLSWLSLGAGVIILLLALVLIIIYVGLFGILMSMDNGQRLY